MNAQSIYNDINTGLLKIVWSDNLTQEFRSSFLRNECQCAICKSNRINHHSYIASEPLWIMDIHFIGAYGVQFVFSDGHDRGIYPWVYLRKLGQEDTLIKENSVGAVFDTI